MKIGKAVLSVGLLVIAGLGSSAAQGTQEGRFSKIHFRAGTWLLVGNSAPALSRNLTSWGFGDDRRTWAVFWSIPSSYPKVSNRARFDLQLEYSITRTIGLALAVSSLANASGKGFDLLGIDWLGHSLGNSLHVSVRGTAYFLSASYMPPPRSGQRFSPRVGLGVGVSDIEVAFETNIRGKVFEGKPLCGLVFAGLDCWLLRHWTVGLTLQYRYVPSFKPGAFEISAEYMKTYKIPDSDYDLDGVAFGINMGLHF